MAAGGFLCPGRDVRFIGHADEWWEDGRNGMPSLSVSGHPVVGGVRLADDKRGALIPGEADS